jgi:hypothetical protein
MYRIAGILRENIFSIEWNAIFKSILVTSVDNMFL